MFGGGFCGLLRRVPLANIVGLPIAGAGTVLLDATQCEQTLRVPLAPASVYFGFLFSVQEPVPFSPSEPGLMDLSPFSPQINDRQAQNDC